MVRDITFYLKNHVFINCYEILHIIIIVYVVPVDKLKKNKIYCVEQRSIFVMQGCIVVKTDRFLKFCLKTKLMTKKI